MVQVYREKVTIVVKIEMRAYEKIGLVFFLQEIATNAKGEEKIM